jgi:hypothetical protein
MRQALVLAFVDTHDVLSQVQYSTVHWILLSSASRVTPKRYYQVAVTYHGFYLIPTRETWSTHRVQAVKGTSNRSDRVSDVAGLL